MSRRIPRAAAAWLAVLALSTTALAACGSSDDDKTTSSSGAVQASEDATIAGQVPAAIKSKGTLTVAADATYPPNEFIKPGSKTVVGMDPDLAKALGQVMGLKVNVVNATFDSIIPGLAAKKYDLGMSSFTDTREREKTVDFVTYYSAGTSFFTKGQGGTTLTGGLAGLCGKTIAAEKGTTQADDATAQGKKCKAQGKGDVKVLVYPDQNGANLALSSGRAQIVMADSPVADYQVKQSNGQFKLVGTPYGPYPYGIAIPKGAGMTKPVLAALKKLIAGGQYQQILKTWGIQSGGISNPVIDGATS